MGLEPIGIFFAAIVWWEIIALAIVGIVMVGFMWEEHAAVPFVGLLLILFYSWGDTYGPLVEINSLFDVWLFLLIYIAIGLGWSFFKWGRLVSSYIEKYEKEEDVRYYLKQFSYDSIAYWVLWFPFSMIGFVFDDAIQWIISRFRGVYNLITDRMISSAINTNTIKKAVPIKDN